MEVLEVREHSLLVRDAQNQKTAIAKYEDNGGVYFFDENLDKKYVTTSPEKDVNVTSPKIPPNKKGRYTFETTMYANDDFSPGRTYTRTFKANSFAEAEEKHRECYGEYLEDYFDTVLVEAYDREGYNIPVKEIFS